MKLSVYSISQIMMRSKHDIATLFVQLNFLAVFQEWW